MPKRGSFLAGNAKRARVGGCKQQVDNHDAMTRAVAQGSVDCGVATPGATSSNVAAMDGRSFLARGLMNEVMWGFLSPVAAHRIATWGVQDGITKADLAALSEMGSNGIHTRNVWRDITTNLKSPAIVRARDSIKLEMLDTKENEFDCDTSVLLPHRLLAAMWSNERQELTTRILGGNPSNVTRFWSEMAEVENPNYMVHPMHRHPRFDHRTSAVPIACHFDGVASLH